jgi:hypothetical protein
MAYIFWTTTSRIFKVYGRFDKIILAIFRTNITVSVSSKFLMAFVSRVIIGSGMVGVLM